MTDTSEQHHRSVPKPEPTEAPSRDWDDLSDAELMGRLMRRGVEAVTAKGWVRDRQSEYVAEEITATLGLVFRNDEGQEMRLEIPMENRPTR